MRNLVVVVVLILAAILLSASWRNHTADRVGPRPAATVVDPTGTSGLRSDPRAGSRLGSAGAAGARSSGLLDGIQTVSQLQWALDRSGLSAAQRLENLRLVAMSCDRPSKRGHIHDAKMKADAKFRRNQEYSDAYYKNFCNVAMVPYWELIERVMEQDPTDPVVMAHGLSMLKGEQRTSVGVPMAQQLLESESIEAHYPAAIFLMVEERDLPAATRHPFPVSIDTPQERADAQFLALAMVACQRRGGCHAGGWHTLRNCGTECAPNRSLAQVWNARYPPETIAYARRLAADMLGRLRRSG